MPSCGLKKTGHEQLVRRRRRVYAAGERNERARDDEHSVPSSGKRVEIGFEAKVGSQEKHRLTSHREVFLGIRGCDFELKQKGTYVYPILSHCYNSKSS